MYTIAIDGPSGSGKSTVAKRLSNELNILYLDTGAMYRACALEALRRGINDLCEESVSVFIDEIDLKIEYKNGVQKTILRGVDVSLEIRENSISMLASNISALKCVRMKMVEMQREVTKGMSAILDGRDIGTYVLPDATFKFYITATAEVRAKRRFDELIGKGQSVEYNQILKEIKARDYNDINRNFAPLKQADDAVYIDTSAMQIDQVVSCILKAVLK